MVTKDGEHFVPGILPGSTSNKHYYITRFDHNVSEDYTVIDDVENNYITLGADNNLQMRILGIDTNIPEIELSTHSLSPGCNEGENAPSDTFTIKNCKGGTLNYTITTDANWITCSPASGTSTGEADTITVNYNTSNLNVGNYNGTITISDPSSMNSPQTISVNLNVGQPSISLSPMAKTIVCSSAENSDQFQLTVKNSGQGILNYTVSPDVDWLSCDPSSGSLSAGESQNITININTTTLSNYSHEATITVSDSNADNSPQETKIYVYNFEGTGNIIWRKDITYNGSERVYDNKPVIYDGNLYPPSDIPFALNCSNGEQVWLYQSEHNFFNEVAIPLLVNGKEYVGGENGVYCFDADSGNLIWTNDSVVINTSIVYYNGNIYFSDGRRLYCLNPSNGDLVWKTDRIFRVNSPNLAVSDGVVYMVGSDGLYAADLSDGHTLWHYTSDKLNHHNTHGSGCVVYNDSVFVGSDNEDDNKGYLYSFDKNTGSLNWKKEISSSDDEIYIINPCTYNGVIYVYDIRFHLYAVYSDSENIKWETKMPDEIYTVNIYNGLLYVGSFSSSFYHLCVLDPDDGKLLWYIPAVDEDDNGIVGVNVDSNGYVYFLEEYGYINCVRYQGKK